MNKFTYLLLFLFCMMGVMNAQELEISGFTKAAENRTLPAELTTGYYLIKEVNIIAKTKRAEIENEMSKTSLFSLPFFSCIYWDLNNN